MSKSITNAFSQRLQKHRNERKFDWNLLFVGLGSYIDCGTFFFQAHSKQNMVVYYFLQLKRSLFSRLIQEPIIPWFLVLRNRSVQERPSVREKMAASGGHIDLIFQ